MAETMQKTTAMLRELIKNGEPEAKATLAKEGKLTARDRMNLLFDEGTFVEVGAYIGRKRTELDIEKDDSFEPVVTGYGAVNGELVYAFSQDYSRLHGALGEMHAKKIVQIIQMAENANAPLVGVFDSAGAKILEGVDALAGYGAIMNAVDFASVPKIAVISGVCGGASAVIAKMFDIVIAAEKTGKLFAAPAGTKAEGIAENASLYDIKAADDKAAVLAARDLIPYFGSVMVTGDDANRLVDVDIDADVHGVIEALVDAGSFTELGGHRAKTMVTGLAAVNGTPVAIVANNPAEKSGVLCPCGIKNAIRFLSFAYEQNLPVITLVNSVGVTNKADAEKEGLVTLLANLAKAYSRVGRSNTTVVLGAAYGTAYTVMGSKALTDGLCLALDSAKISALSPESAVAFLDEVKDESKHKETAEAWAARYASPLEAAKSGHIDDIIDSAELRQRVAAALAVL